MNIVDRNISALLAAIPTNGRRQYLGSVMTLMQMLHKPSAWRNTTRLLRKPGGWRLLWAYLLSLISGASHGQSSQFTGPLMSVPTVPRPEGAIEVSVVLTVHNQEEDLLRAFMSVISQTFSSWELIVWDDGSTNPRTLQILSEIGTTAQQRGTWGDRIRVFNTPNQGVVTARNSAASHARGRWLVFLDPDDEFHPTYLEKSIIALEGLPGCDIAGPDVRLVGHPKAPRWNATPLKWPDIRMFNHLPISSVLLLDTFRAVGGFRKEFDLGWEDWDLWVRLTAANTRSLRLPEPLFRYTHSEDTGRDATSGRPNELMLRQQILKTQRDSKNQDPTQVVCANLTDVLASFPSRNFGNEHPSVVFFIPWLLKGGGADQFLRTLARSLTERGFRLIFIATEPHIPQDARDDSEEFMWEFPFFYHLPAFMHPDNFDAFTRSVLRDLENPTLVCMGSRYFYRFLDKNDGADGFSSRIIDILFNDQGHTEAHSVNNQHFTDVVLAYSDLERMLVERRVVSARTHVIPVGIEPASSTEACSRPPDGRVRIGWIGRLSEEKRPMWFVNLATALGDIADFKMVGTGPQLRRIKRSARRAPTLEVTPYVDDIDDFYRDLDLLVISSETEGIPLVAMEAASRGIPIVSTDVGGLKDVIQDGRNGRLVDPLCYSFWEATIESLISDRAELQLMQDFAGQHRLSPHFHVEAMVQRYDELFKGLI